MELPPVLVELMKQPSTAYIATLMPDGSPQLSQTWIDTDGRHVIFNTPEEFQKARNLRRDHRIAVTVSDPAEPSRYFAVRGRVTSMTREGGAEHIETLSQRYLGAPYPWYGGRDQVRIIVTIEADRIHTQGG
ncbi:PPOX class F420-dependent oxidoreductase [Mycolicibacterium hodleri]|uniref:PPOX class F420-dependent oxidoreductase n=1 Tax=Mycolicibacterium hodleri TaxID=49897 RepID=A0A502EIG1_9MYCO|nr:PPOX class F420-dependent oxidoreductase [Mycolicibacterium hodleri]TPG37485.1 PPOX class F420-dependent oxidoreductase [Mycolicibacterium hodleri]